ncbi:MAG: hypothetical protein KDD43_10015, partial [Bdellovibrionales bacterium]|nr:hypothetical protein [Bdellovibrionales bacterium]
TLFPYALPILPLFPYTTTASGSVAGLSVGLDIRFHMGICVSFISWPQLPLTVEEGDCAKMKNPHEWDIIQGNCPEGNMAKKHYSHGKQKPKVGALM